MTDLEWAAKVREIYSQRGLFGAIHFAALHGFMLSWVLHTLFSHPHHHHTIIFPF